MMIRWQNWLKALKFRRQFFGVRSEKTSASKKEEAEKKTIQVKGYTAQRKKKATREELYANLPVREILCTVPTEMDTFRQEQV